MMSNMALDRRHYGFLAGFFKPKGITAAGTSMTASMLATPHAAINVARRPRGAPRCLNGFAVYTGGVMEIGSLMLVMVVTTRMSP
jgi:hypothetical protein